MASFVLKMLQIYSFVATNILDKLIKQIQSQKCNIGERLLHTGHFWECPYLGLDYNRTFVLIRLISECIFNELFTVTLSIVSVLHNHTLTVNMNKWKLSSSCSVTRIYWILQSPTLCSAIQRMYFVILSETWMNFNLFSSRSKTLPLILTAVTLMHSSCVFGLIQRPAAIQDCWAGHWKKKRTSYCLILTMDKRNWKALLRRKMFCLCVNVCLSPNVHIISIYL